MKLKETLMGIRIMSGHIVVHFSLLASSFFIDTGYKDPKFYDLSAGD